MALVGDLLVTVRRQIPDLPSVMTAPSSITLAAVNNANGVIASGTTVYVKGSALNQWGETVVTAEVSVVVTAPNNAVQVTFNGTPASATLFRAYYGTASGAQDRFEAGATSPVTILGTGFTAAKPPSRNTAFLPDTDGKFLSAAALYDMLNQSLDELMRIGGGVLDITGVQAISGTLSYRVPANWFNFTDIWYDGWTVQIVPRSVIFLRNSFSGLVGYASVEHDGASHVLTLWPQPSRTGGATTLNGALSATATTITLTDASGFLSMGLVQVESEICVYSQVSGNQLTGVLRGVGGTVAVAHATGVAATELNVRLAGKRTLGNVAMGSAAISLDVPPAWDRAARLFMMHLVRGAEQDETAAQALLKQFEGQVQLLTKASRQRTAPRQVVSEYWDGRDVYNQHLGGAWYLP